ncbi:MULTISPECIES: ABC transporter substrate-binding protein [Lysinibacillus]|uniref:ABC transporter substrate-binding protein n=1 Tax=Lysinibacillus fusiformis TaxID=28031 RepID=A0A2I0V298_9BACI|nr:MULTISPECIES: ABC transporter substrate-binding protein [Lysinibacillus]KUF29401.1 peptide ABC transporter substrate-binding protein [Lysinibacillus sp. F5]PKU52430.1 ABC transporter substrate-binding protein [Lysinibacillus fusiformis]
MKKINVKKPLLLLFLTLLIGVLAACGGNTEKSNSSNEKDGEVTSGGKLNVGLSANAKTFDPIKYTGVYESQVMRQMGDTLVVYNKDLSDIIPSLATEWKVSDDMLVYTFKLREGVKFQKGQYQDGREMTAEDVKYSLERSAKESAMNRLSGVTEVKVLSDYEIEIHLTTPNAALLAMLTDAGNIIIPKEEVEGWGDNFSEHFIGTGPFQLTEWKKDQEVKLVRHDNYWGEKPHVDILSMKFISDQNMMTNALRSGDIDIAMDVKGQNREIINQDSNLELLTNPGLSIVYLDLNNKVGPTADKRVREALYMATNVEEIISGVNQWGGGDVSYLPLPPGSWGYDKSLVDLVPKYNPEEAKKLLAEAGYPDGFKTEIYVSEARVPYATIFQSQLKKNLNIDVEIKVLEWGTYSDTVAKGNAPMNIGGWTWYPDPYFFLYQLFHTNQIGALGNGKGYSNPEVDKLLERAVSETVVQEERAKLYQEALKLILADVPRIELEATQTVAGVNKKVQGFEVSTDNSVQIVHPNGTNVSISK